MVARAGVCPGTTHFSHAAFIPGKSFMSGRKICAESSFDLSLPTCFRSLSIFASTCSVCSVMSFVVSSGTSPARYTVLPCTTISDKRLPTLNLWMAICLSPGLLRFTERTRAIVTENTEIHGDHGGSGKGSKHLFESE